MQTEHLKEVFSNYLTTVAFCHSPEVESRLEAAGSSIFIDVFAHLPLLNSWVLCWSTTGPNTVNRVFIADTHADFTAATTPPKIIHVALQERSAKDFSETDVALLYTRRGMETIAYCPLQTEGGGVFGVIRLIGRNSDIISAGYPKGEARAQNMSLAQAGFPDPDLLPHVLGRWAGSMFRPRETSRPLAVLLKAFASFFTSSHVMYWKRNFDADEIGFHLAADPTTERIVRGLRAPLHSHDYMFAIVAERGASEIVEDFPNALQTDLRINASKWKKTPVFSELCSSLSGNQVSYIGIPLKVDDSVIGVLSILTPRNSNRNFLDAARFARSAFAEMGRTIDKSAVSRTSRLIREFAWSKASEEHKKSNLIALGQELVSKLVHELIPFGQVTVGSLEARLGAEEAGESGLPADLAALIQKQLIELVVSDKIKLFVVEPEPGKHPHTGLLVVPVPAGLPFVLYVFGPLNLLCGRSLRAALEQMQAVLLVSIAASEGASALGGDLGNWREHLALWSQIHDIKNDTAAFGLPLSKLLNVSQNGTHADLIEQVLEFKSKFNQAIADFEKKCDQTLRGAGYRQRQAIAVYDAIRRAWVSVNRTDPEAMRRCRGRFIGDRTVVAVTYPDELELVIRNLLTNVVKHFKKQSKFGTVLFKCEKVEAKKEIFIRITDDVPEPGAAKRVNEILDDPDSRDTLHRLIKPIVERQLQGRIWAEPNSETDSVVLVLGLPFKASVH